MDNQQPNGQDYNVEGVVVTSRVQQVPKTYFVIYSAFAHHLFFFHLEYPSPTLPFSLFVQTASSIFIMLNEVNNRLFQQSQTNQLNFYKSAFKCVKRTFLF